MNKPLQPILLCITLLLSIAIDQTEAASPEKGIKAPKGPRQVILLIGDGMDEQQITIARNYLKGSTGELLLDQMPVRAAMQILTTENKVNGRAVYVGDSANTATSMATGHITSRGRIGTSAGDDRDLPNIVELAAAAGYRTGIVTTASVTDATPAAFATHISYRMCQGPAEMESVVYHDIYLGNCKADLKANGGPGSIAEQLAASPLDVLLGGGSQYFDANAEGSSKTVAQLAQDNGFQRCSSAQELAAVTPGQRVLGLFSKDTMPVRLRGENDRSAEAPEPSLLNHLHHYLGDVTLPPPMACEANPDYDAVPSLRQMTDTALAQLAHDNKRGFFLMIESASIDKQSHERKPCGSIGEVQQLNEALSSVLKFAYSHPHTLIVVTADHSQAAQLIPNESLYAAFPIPMFTPGKLARIKTPEGSIMAVNYATTNFVREEHTGAAVPLFTNAEGRFRVPAFLRQPQIFNITREYLGL